MKRILNKFTNKSFILEMDTAIGYANSQEVCDAIMKYAEETKENLRFVSKEMPVTFYLNDDYYVTQRRSHRGGPYVSCHSQEPPADEESVNIQK